MELTIKKPAASEPGPVASHLPPMRQKRDGSPHADFGWRLHGKPVGSLTDSSLKLQPSRQLTAQLAAYCNCGTALQSCLQCGACTVNCQLAEAHSQFPRRQMTLLQMGDAARLLADPKVWLCFNCEDCTSSCPAKAGPGRIMAAVRRLAVEHYSVPHLWGRIANQKSGFVGIVVAAVWLLAGVIAVGGSFSPQLSPVRFSSMLPHVSLNLFFGLLVGAVLLAAAISAGGAWQAFSGEELRKANFRRVIRSATSVVREIATHQQFSECRQFPGSRWAHGMLFYGFFVLVLLAAFAALLIATGSAYPLAFLHPLKIAGNIAAVLVIAGSLYFIVQRSRASRDRQASSWFDWALPLQILLISLTGLLAEIFRYTNLGKAAYPTYFLHLVLVLIFFAGASSSKLAHAFYRTVALIADHYNETCRVNAAELYGRKLAA